MIFKYYVLFWDELEKENKVSKGVIIANSFTEATKQIIEAYTEDGLIKLHIDACEEGNFCELECRKAHPHERAI